MCVWVFGVRVRAGQEAIHVVVLPHDVEISNGSPSSKVHHEPSHLDTSMDAAIAWRLHESDSDALMEEANSSVIC